MTRAQQLPLMVSLADSARLQMDCEQAEAYAREQQDRAKTLSEENATLRDALKAEQARNLELQRELILAQTLAKTWQAQVELWRRTDLPVPRPTPSRDVLTELLVLAHPDKWQHQPAAVLAHELAVTINKLREGATA